MRNSNYFELMQNSAVSAIALHAFVLGYHNVAKRKEGFVFPKLAFCFYVLPIIYNQEAMETFRSSNELYTVLVKNKAIILNLEERAYKMAGQTFKSLGLAFSKKILFINKEQSIVELGRGFATRKLPLALSMNESNNDVKKIQDCAFKLGAIFSKRNVDNIRFELNISL